METITQTATIQSEPTHHEQHPSDAIHIMLDIETLGFDPTRHPILSIAAVRFDPYATSHGIDQQLFNVPFVCVPHEGIFFAVLSLEQQLNDGREIDFSTLRWWMENGDKCRLLEEWIRYIPDTIDQVALRFMQFDAWVNETSQGKFVCLWAHGNTFDIPFVKEYFSQFQIKWPFNYKGLNECRSMPTIYELCTKQNFTWPESTSNKHHPLEDCLKQIMVVQHVVESLRR